MSDLNNTFDENWINELGKSKEKKSEVEEKKESMESFVDNLFNNDEFEKKIQKQNEAHAERLKMLEEEEEKRRKKEQKEAEERQQKEQHQQRLNVVLSGIKGNMPPVLKATLNDVLAAIEEKLTRVTSDTRRAARFDKVRNAVAIYNMVREPSDKYRAILGVREAAANYLMERKAGSYQNRKELCEELVRDIDGFIDVAKNEKHHDPAYLALDEYNIPEELLDAELSIAYKHVCADPHTSVSDLKDRKKAYLRKIKDVKLAHKIRDSLLVEKESITSIIEEANIAFDLKENIQTDGYDNAANIAVLAYTRLNGLDKERTMRLTHLLSINEEDGKEFLEAKKHKLKDILLEIMSWDMNEFEFKNPEDFLHRSNEHLGETKYFKRLYSKLQLASVADVLMDELYSIAGDDVFSDNMEKQILSRIGVCKAMMNEYEDRLDMMSNPYYALLLEKDTARFKEGGDINSVTADKAIPGAQSMFEASRTLKDYIEAVGRKQDRIRSGKSTTDKELVFTRNTSAKKLLAEQKKALGARAELDEQEYKLLQSSVGFDIQMDWMKLEAFYTSEEQKRIRERNAAENERIKREQEEKKRQDELKKAEEDRLAKEKAARDLRNIRLSMLNDMVLDYDKLATAEGKPEDAADLRVRMIRYIKHMAPNINYNLDYISTDCLYQVIRQAIDEYENPVNIDLRLELLTVKEIRGHFSNGIKAKDEYFTSKIAELEAKGEKATAQDKLLLKEYKHLFKAKKDRETLEEAVNAHQFGKLVDAITKICGGKPQDLEGFVTFELADFATGISKDTLYPEEIAAEYQTMIAAAKHIHGREFYEMRAGEHFNNVRSARNGSDFPDDRDLKAMAEYTILQMREEFEIPWLKFEDFGDDGEKIFAIPSHLRILLTYKEVDLSKLSKEEREASEADIAFSRQFIAKLKLSKEAKQAFELLLGFETEKYIPKKAKEKDSFRDVEMKNFGAGYDNPEKQAYKESYAYFQEVRKKSFDENKKKQRSADVPEETGVNVSSYSDNARMTLTQLGNLFELGSNSDLDTNAHVKLKGYFSGPEGGNFLAVLLEKDKKTGNQVFEDVFKELMAGATQKEKNFVHALTDSLRVLLKAVQKAGEGKQPDALMVPSLIPKGLVDDALKEMSEKLEKAMDVFDEDMEPVMDMATYNVFDQATGAGLPTIDTFLPGLHEALIEGEEILKKQKLDETKSAREKIEVRKKSDKQRLDEQAELDQKHTNLLYDVERGQGKFIQGLISGYYKNASIKDKRLMLSFVIRDMKKSGENRSQTEIGCDYFASILKGAGPIMQKMMQGVPERMVIPEMQPALNVVKSSLRPIDLEYRKKVIARIKAGSKKEIIKIDKIQSLGAASVAETFSARVVYKDRTQEEVVIKILRPDAKKRMKSEEKFILKTAMYADMTPKEIKAYEKAHGNRMVPHEPKVTESGFLAQYSEIKKEFNFNNEIANCELGKQNYIKKYSQKPGDKNNRHVKTVNINDNFAPAEDYLVMDKAEGITVDKITQKGKNQENKVKNIFKNKVKGAGPNYVMTSANAGQFWKNRKALTGCMHQAVETSKLLGDLAFVWVEQAIYGSGLTDSDNFHHGDMHAGNIMVNLKDGNTTVLDYGNAVILKDKKVNQILSMISSVALSRADFFVEAFDNMLGLAAADEKDSKNKVGFKKLTPEEKQIFIEKLDNLFRLGTAQDTGKKIIVALNVAQEIGVKLPKEIQNFSQCQQRLENTLMETRHVAINLNSLVHELDNMPVAKEDEDSFDPLIKLHKKLADYNQESKADVIERQMGSYKYYGGMEEAQAATKIKTKADYDNYIQTNLPEYLVAKDIIKLEEIPAKAKAIRENYAKAVESMKKGERAPRDVAMALALANNDFLMIFDGNTELTEITTEVLSPSDEKSYKPENFEQVMFILEHYIPAILKAGAGAEKMIGSDKLPFDELNKLTKETARSIYDVSKAKTINQAPAIELRVALDKADTPEAEADVKRRISGLLARSADLKYHYDKYVEANEEYKSAVKGGDAAAIETAKLTRDMMIDNVVNMFMNNSNAELDDAKECFSMNYEEKALQKRDTLPDFVSVMSEVVDEHLIRSVGKLNSGIAGAVKAMDKEEGKLQKAAKKEAKAEEDAKKAEEEKKKKDEENKKKAAEKAKKAEEERLKKEAEKKAAAEKKEKERLAKLAKEEQARKEKLAKEEKKRLEKLRKEQEKQQKELAKKQSAKKEVPKKEQPKDTGKKKGKK